ncbi:MAG: hypothetical protein IPL61_12925 [Myxococcales bacterium]|nr:hypothetical protein [Myxococcales bacterium]
MDRDVVDRSLWRWRVTSTQGGWLVSAIVVFLALVAALIFAEAHHYPPGGGSIHTLEDELGPGPLWAIVALALLACVRGRVWVRAVRDLVMLALATYVAAVTVPHPHLVYDDFDDLRGLRDLFAFLAGAVAVQIVISVVELAPVLRAVRISRRLARARAVRRSRRAAPPSTRAA